MSGCHPDKNEELVGIGQEGCVADVLGRSVVVKKRLKGTTTIYGCCTNRNNEVLFEVGGEGVRQ
jgi:hypothetical protein